MLTTKVGRWRWNPSLRWPSPALEVGWRRRCKGRVDVSCEGVRSVVPVVVVHMVSAPTAAVPVAS